ncbi:helix-turn-helix domain-containing protein [Polaribacter sp. SA4-12]|uniref:helix-turn-helix domain-containing protein n=1 Tax=Polaribacter sp. SA4-12 TaxID=1312072 RepID=UPI0012F859D4|nr:AraC family transcriptional regulator [Polaribacter sp. SA4-12]
MEQYYTTFTIRLPNKLSIYQLYNFNIEVKASSFHYELFKKLCSANPNMSLPSGNPLEYQKMNLNAFKNKQNGSKENLISSGIISLLLSEFINSTKMELKTESMNKIPESILFIHQNLSNRLNISELSAKYSMSSDHYTRKFKELTKQNPIDYINRQRIEKALLLLNTTSYSCKEIGYQCGFNSNTYFSKMFKKYVKFSPNDYRASLDNL